MTGNQEAVYFYFRKKRRGERFVRVLHRIIPKIGVMLPYAPVQLLLFDYQDETKVSDCLG